MAPRVDIDHPAWEVPTAADGRVVSLLDGLRTDRERLAATLQAAALLAHLEEAGGSLAAGWRGAGVDGRGRLRLSGAPRPGRSPRLPQEELREFLARVFAVPRGGPVPGRGEARRAARALQRRWAPTLVALPPDDAVGQLLDEAPFLWEPRFAAARLALVAVVRGRPRVAGPGGARRRLLAAAATPEELRELLAGSAGRRLWWPPAPGGDPCRLAAAGRWRAAVAHWRLEPPRDDASRRACADAWFALGRFEKALAVLATVRRRTGAADLLRASCQLHLGRAGAARATVRRLLAAGVAPCEEIPLAELAVRLTANAGDPAAARRHGRETLHRTERRSGHERVRALVLAAQAAWDGGDLAAMERHLAAAARGAGGGAGWRWRQARALLALERGAPEEACRQLAAALRTQRRRLRRFEAAGVWNDLGLARARCDDLAGAERAFLHAFHLHRRCDGPRALTLGATNLAEIRLRRGRLLGVEEILARSAAADRAAGNRRGGVFDELLQGRYEMVRGRPAAALDRLRRAAAAAQRLRLSGARAEARVLTARVLGGEGRAAAAAAELAAAGGSALAHLEPEERPAVLALAGRLEEARRAAAAAGDLGAVWRALLAPGGGAAGAEAWAPLGALEPFRRARLVADVETFAPGTAPESWRRAAIATFRRLGAPGAARRLEDDAGGPWEALAGWLDGEVGVEGWQALLAAAGYPEARLWWEGRDDARVLVPGPGGAEELTAPARGGRLVLRASVVDPPLRALFRLLRRELPALPAGRPVAPAGDPAAGLVGRSRALRAAVERVERLAPTDLPLLIVGESGTGKELLARHLHRSSARAARPLLPVNCAALSATLLTSDLFGHVRGAFTGADRDRAGVFEAAEGGTVFLDEIGDLPAVAQGMLLRVLQEGEVRRVGESLARRVDVRVVAATHRDLAARVGEGLFREDLYYRLKGAAVELPPLRERGADVLLLAEHLLRAAADRCGRPPPRLGAAARARLRAHRWPGNVRELENVLASAAVLAAADGGVVRPEHLDLPAASGPAAAGYHVQVDTLRRRLVREALADSGGVQAVAARRLGLSRQALSYLVRRFELR